MPLSSAIAIDNNLQLPISKRSDRTFKENLMSGAWKNQIASLFVIVIFSSVILGCGDSNSDSDQHVPAGADEETGLFFQDLEFIASKPRTTGSEHHTAVRSMCVERFEELGFQVELHEYESGVNVLGTIPGLKNPEELVVVSAHYDSVPDCNSADDNASGVAGLFETARILSAQDYDRTLVVACLDEEEKGMLGSSAYVSRVRETNSDIIISYVFDMIGYKDDAPNSQQLPENFEFLFPEQAEQVQNNEYRGDFIILMADDRAMDSLTGIVEFANSENLPVLKLGISSQMLDLSLLPDALRADHVPFWEEGIPAVLINDTAEFRNPYYHCNQGTDNVETLDVDFAMKVTRTIAEQVRESLNSDK